MKGGERLACAEKQDCKRLEGEREKQINQKAFFKLSCQLRSEITGAFNHMTRNQNHLLVKQYVYANAR